MYDPISIETALVSSSGDLLVQLTDGNIINAGRVKGEKGDTGERGYMGPEGERGTDGTNGARWHTGIGAPEVEDGTDGDLYMDVASSLLPIYQKINGSWLFLANLKATPTGSSGGGSGDGTSSNGSDRPVIISPDFGTPNNPGTPPSFHPNFSGPDANLRDGDLWIDGNGVLYFYFKGQWNKNAVYTDKVLPADDAPFTITTPNGEVFDNQRGYNEWLYERTHRSPIFSTTPPTVHPDFPAYPLKEGDFWIDDDKDLFYWNGTEWVLLTDTNVVISDTAPTPATEGQLWFDNSDDELTLYIYTGSEWVPAAPPVSLDGINATIDAALLIQADLVDRVTAGETAQTSLQGTVSSALETQQGIQEDILTLQQELDALENTRYVGTWNAIDDDSKNGRPPGDGNFYFNQGGLATGWDLVGWLYIADVDSNGVSFTHSDIQVGDQIEVISKTENSYGIYTIQSTSDAGDYIAIQIEVLNRSDGVPAVGPHLIKIFSIDNGIDLGEADARYMKLRGNQQLDKDVTWRIRQDALDDTGNTFISIKDGEMNLYHVADPNADTHAANQKYVDEQVDTRLPLTGGSMTGGIDIDRESGAGLELKKEGTSNLKLWVDGGITTTKTTFNDDQLVTKDYVDTADGLLGQMITLNAQDAAKKVDKSGDTMTGELKIDRASGYNHLLLKTGGTNAIKVGSYTANETRLQVYNGQFFKVVGYVNDTLTQLFGVSSSGRVTLSNVRTPTADRDAATKAYVDSLLAAPARLSWKWDSTSSGDSAPATGAFKYTNNGGDHYYRFSFETSNGIKLGESIISEFNRGIDNGPVGTIWYKEANGWKFKQQFRINTFRWNFNNHFEFRVTSRNGSTSFTPGTSYYITVGGFF